MLSKEEIENRNLLENADYGKGESKSVVTSFLITKCDNCGNEIKYRLALEDIKDVEKYIERLEQENNKLNKIIDEMVEEYEYNARCNLNNFCDEEMRKDKCIQDCRICIKQYFEKKVEGK